MSSSDLPAPVPDKEAPGSIWQSDLWHEYPNDDDALRALTRITCPAPCVGVVNDVGWHKGCEARAAEAFKILRGWETPVPDPALVTVRADDLAAVLNDTDGTLISERVDRLRAALVARSAPPVDEEQVGTLHAAEAQAAMRGVFYAGKESPPDELAVDEEQRIEALAAALDTHVARHGLDGWYCEKGDWKGGFVAHWNAHLAAAALTWTKENR